MENRFPLSMRKKSYQEIRKRGWDKVLKEKVTECKAYLMLTPSYCKHRNEK